MFCFCCCFHARTHNKGVLVLVLFESIEDLLFVISSFKSSVSGAIHIYSFSVNSLASLFSRKEPRSFSLCPMTSLLTQYRRPWDARVCLFLVFHFVYLPASGQADEGPEYSALIGTADMKTGPGQSRMTRADYGPEEFLKEFPNALDDFTLNRKDSVPTCQSCKSTAADFYDKDYRFCAKNTAPGANFPCLMVSDYLNSINNKTGKMYKWTTTKNKITGSDAHVWEGDINFMMTEQEKDQLPLDQRSFNNPPNNLAINPFAPAPTIYSTRNVAQCAKTAVGSICPGDASQCDNHAEAKSVAQTCSKCKRCNQYSCCMMYHHNRTKKWKSRCGDSQNGQESTVSKNKMLGHRSLCKQLTILKDIGWACEMPGLLTNPWVNAGLVCSSRPRLLLDAFGRANTAEQESLINSYIYADTSCLVNCQKATCPAQFVAYNASMDTATLPWFLSRNNNMQQVAMCPPDKPLLNDKNTCSAERCYSSDARRCCQAPISCETKFTDYGKTEGTKFSCPQDLPAVFVKDDAVDFLA